MNISRLLFIIFWLFLIIIRTTEACAPRFDTSYLIWGNEFGVFNMPSAHFYHELETLGYKSSEQNSLDDLPNVLKLNLSQSRYRLEGLPTTLKNILNDRELETMSVVDARDLYFALREKGSDKEIAIVKQYLALQKNIQKLKELNLTYLTSDVEAKAKFNKLVQTSIEILEIPKEFKQYLTGVIYYQLGDLKLAQQHWKSLLNLPVAERKYKTAWASYMLAKVLLSDEGKISKSLISKGCEFRCELENTAIADIRDLYVSLREKGSDDETAFDITAQYLALRKIVQEVNSVAGTNAMEKITQVYSGLLDKIPQEFKQYMIGAIHYRLGDFERAQQQWKLLLKLPAAERKYRSTWASYMLGISLSIKYFHETPRYANEGFVDTLNLAGDSYGQVGKIYYQQGDYINAIHNYVEYAKYSEYGHSSLRIVCEAIFRNNTVDEALVHDPLSRRVLTAYVLANLSQTELVELWLKNIQVISPETLSNYEAGRLAWIAYNLGDMKQAQAWVAIDQSNDPYARWVHTKLLLRAGNVEKSIRILQELKNAFPKQKNKSWYVGYTWSSLYNGSCLPHNNIHGELGVLLLARKKYVEAMDLFLRGGYWYDAAYVAEQVLTTAELENYVRHNYPQWLVEQVNEPSEWMDMDVKEAMQTYGERLRYLLARRLLREEQWDKALQYIDYIPLELKETMPTYVNQMKGGRDSTLSYRQRAEYLYAAAQTLRSQGIELLGTEIGPDWAVVEGSFELTSTKLDRLANSNTAYSHVPIPFRRLILASNDEKRRTTRHEVQIDYRFHYRYQAAKLFWEASELLPNNDILTAKSLYYGGKVTIESPIYDARHADRFYKALVNRCRKLAIGQAADQLRWFPPEPSEWRK
ncbi:hypothetical protein PN36_18450 [Candidatus Thiomargarita nelsonii]|uniref:Tetratricopeptide repeat protein n=1 Tax=Candidatus Thiomargarita nelsonii TaxID=1003181 RepID=A0A0A6PG25_9GAMM|nr:hypothetical protein PN36_18450 [Candidatus Thiomargarita nelsonii]